ncbi:EEP domain-containing protein [Agrobacterium vitis]|uniref:endonuclease/exonuclease/phosphatase family protein n=1 Tax=Rhizobium/Agrobacterium group TaxID=227290 RepID=UPI0008DBFC8F|nr:MULTISPECIES: endonuclease/exonuclease/phosphatase family protein [Rhizobium/Agrobacterium group]MCF1432417.1 EEP domain-containing protein [Allorhizobium ampelinum]MUO88047.1 EEP domain-containing protein [Agrobacterium vitis]MUZ50824.1 EEP domain-containing protein [Agrobacterium vitis]MUZ90848.1 EEP domain-containing protein [Agrobacterium vitis]MVA38795.1 EEP domain-containing protein [Agrobacterium vitis]
MSSIFRLLTYNIHSCIGTDRRLDPARIAEVVAATEADIVCLQEVDVGRNRTSGIDQADVIAGYLTMQSHFHSALNVAEERYGDALLTRFPTRIVQQGMLPSRGEQRGALLVEVSIGKISVNVCVTHFGLRAGERAEQARALLGVEWLGPLLEADAPIVVAADLNAVPNSKAFKLLTARLADATKANLKSDSLSRSKPTFPSRFPFLRLDHVLISGGLNILEARVIDTPLARRASDHLPLLVTMQI